MLYFAYPFYVDRESGQVIFSWEYYIPAYVDPETEEFFDQTMWSVTITEPGVGSGGISDYAGESGQVYYESYLPMDEEVHTYIFNAFAQNTFSAVSVSDSWTVITAAYATLSLSLMGGSGFDLILSGSGDDTLQGFDGNDVLDAGEGADTLEGGAGFDQLDGGAGNDVMRGGAGNDFYFVDSAGDSVVELSNEGELDAVFSSVTHTLAANLEVLQLLGSANINGTGNSRDNIVSGNAGNNILRGGNGDDVVYGDAGNDTLQGNNGNDYLDGGAGFNTMIGGDGDDTYFIGHLNYVIVEGPGILAGIDTLEVAASFASFTLPTDVEVLVTLRNSGFHGRGNDQRNDVHGGAGNDLLQGFGDSDGLFGGAGNDRLDGGAGADEMRGGDGVDTVLYSQSDSAVFVNLGANTQTGGHAQGDWILGVENVVGSAFDDTLIGILTANTLDGGAGDDTINGYFGNDRIIGGLGADNLDGHDGIDTLDYSRAIAGVTVDIGLNTASGGEAEGDTISNFEHLTGGGGGDTLRGSAGANNIRGMGGDDFIYGGDGNDIIVGGAGADWMEGEGGNNRVSYQGSVGAVTVDLFTTIVSGGDAEGDRIFDFDNADGGLAGDTLYGHDGVNRLGGLEGDDELYGRGGADVLFGGAGADRLDGGAGGDTASYAGSRFSVSVSLLTGVGALGDAAGDTYVSIEHVTGSESGDYIQGNNGVNRLNGGGGFDFLDGGAGNDVLTGGAQGDLFRFHYGHDRDIIKDFTQGADQIFIDFDGNIFTFESVMTFASAYGESGEHTQFDFGNGDVLIVENMQVADFTANDFTYLIG